MKKEINHNIRKRFNEIIYNTARYTEIILSVVILVVIALAGISMIHDITRISLWDMDIDFFYGVSVQCAVAGGGRGVYQNAVQAFRAECGRGAVVCHRQTDGGGTS